MALMVRASDTEAREPVPEGSYKAILVGIYEIGTDSGGMYGPKHQAILTWELHRRGLTRPYLISGFYTLSFHVKSKLRQHVEAMLGRSFREGDELRLEQLLRTCCRLQVGHKPRADENETPYAIIKGLMPLDDDEPEPRPVNAAIYFEITDPGCPIPAAVPSWIRTRIERSPEYTGHAEPAAAMRNREALAVPESRAGDDDIAF